MFVKILGAFDLFAALVLFLIALKVHIAAGLLVFLIVVLAIKGLPSLMSFCAASIIDVVIAIILLICIFTTPPGLLLMIAAFGIGQKGAFSFL